MKKGMWALKTNESKELEGTWVEYPDDTYDLKFKVRRTGGKNSEFAETVEAAMRPIRRQFAAGKKDKRLKQKAMEEMVKLYSEHIVVGWEGSDIVDEEGNPLPFSSENCFKVLSALPEIMDWVVTAARDADTFREEIDLELEVKN